MKYDTKQNIKAAVVAVTVWMFLTYGVYWDVSDVQRFLETPVSEMTK